MKSLFIGLVVVLLSSAVSQVARAGEFGIGLMAGQASFDEINNICSDVRRQNPLFTTLGCISPEDTDSASGFNVSYHFNDTWAIEGGYVDLGEYSTRLFVVGNSTDITLSADAMYLAAVGTLPLSNRFSLSGRTGIYEPSGEVSSGFLAETTEIDGDAEFYAGASLDFRATDNIVLQVRYDGFDEIGVLAAGVQFRF